MEVHRIYSKREACWAKYLQLCFNKSTASEHTAYNQECGLIFIAQIKQNGGENTKMIINGYHRKNTFKLPTE